MLGPAAPNYDLNDGAEADIAEGVPTSLGARSEVVQNEYRVAQPARLLPGGVETEMSEYLMAKLGQMWVAPMAGIRPGIRDFRLDVCRALAQHDNAAGKE